MTEVSIVRLWAMKAMYLIMAAGIGATIWPSILNHGPDLPRMTGGAFALLGAIGLLALLGLRYPLQMVPLLLVELVWKTIWLTAFALPRWLDGSLDDGMRSSIFDTSLGAIVLLVIPWRYVWDNYVVKAGEAVSERRTPV